MKLWIIPDKLNASYIDILLTPVSLSLIIFILRIIAYTKKKNKIINNNPGNDPLRLLCILSGSLKIP